MVIIVSMHIRVYSQECLPSGGFVGNRLSSEAGRNGFRFLGVLPVTNALVAEGYLNSRFEHTAQRFRPAVRTASTAGAVAKWVRANLYISADAVNVWRFWR